MRLLDLRGGTIALRDGLRAVKSTLRVGEDCPNSWRRVPSAAARKHGPAYSRIRLRKGPPRAHSERGWERAHLSLLHMPPPTRALRRLYCNCEGRTQPPLASSLISAIKSSRALLQLSRPYGECLARAAGRQRANTVNHGACALPLETFARRTHPLRGARRPHGC